jgi:hypothetical protein
MGSAVAPQFTVPPDLLRGENIKRREVITQMGKPQGALRRTNLRRCGFQARGRNRFGGELTVEVSLLCDQAIAQGDGLGLHSGMKRLHARPLIIGQSELVAQLKNMDRARVSIEFGRQGQTHATAGAEVSDLLIGQRLHSPMFPAGVG